MATQSNTGSDATPILLQADAVRGLVAQVFVHLNVPEADAQMAADVLVRADLRGVSSHGINNLWQYVDPLRKGTLNPRPNLVRVRESPVTALVDGDGGMGLVIGTQTMQLCIEKARAHGVGMATVRRSRHFGMASYFSLMCHPHDMIGMALTNNAGVAVLPTFGSEPMLSTNPISVVAPTHNQPPFELDMATSVVAMSKIGLALNKGTQIPEGWALDGEGAPTQDAQKAWDGRQMLPLGATPELSSYKGYGLAVVVDILTGVLAGGAYGNLAQRNPPQDEKVRNGSSHFFMALNVDFFRPIHEFKADMDDMLRALKGSPKAPGHDRIYVAGEMEHETEQERLVQGIPYHPYFVTQLRQLAAEFEIPFSV